MEPNPLLFRDLTYIFLAAVLGGLLAWRLNLPLILGFVLGGIAISPFTPGPHLSELHSSKYLLKSALFSSCFRSVSSSRFQISCA
jgi:Kef-type K+ transport system membrane component KefB